MLNRGRIKINDEWWNCVLNYDSAEYKKYQIASPIPEFKFVKIIDEITAYLVDAANIVWILELQIVGREEGFMAFNRPSLIYCLDYIMQLDIDMKGKRPSEVSKIVGIEDQGHDGCFF